MAQAKKPSKTPTKTKASAAKAKNAPDSSGSSSSIDSTTMAAAASMVAHKVVPTAPATAGQTPTTESASFRQMKQSLNKPHSQIMGGLLDKISTPGQKKSALPFGGGKQIGHNQIVGSDASRKNVPRRTGG